MNKGHIQAERAASAQRDLFDTQLRIEDQLIEQKSEPHHPGNKPERPQHTGPTVRSLTDTFNSKL